MTREPAKPSSASTSRKRSKRLPTSSSRSKLPKLRVQLRHPRSEKTAAAMLAAYRPPPKLTVSQWADQERRLSPESSPSPGRWHTYRVEYTRGIMDAASDPNIPELVAIIASQMAKTETTHNAGGS